jgi:uncharacterized protein (DUF58 family)
MITKQIFPDIVQKIKEIEISTKRLMSGALAGENRSPLKGTGFDFDQIREYAVGDDVRFIDWNASARMNSLLIKQYVEERSRAILVAVDLSGTSFFSSARQVRRETAAQIASTLALVAENNNDRVGLLLFTDEVELYIPPRQGNIHVRTIINHLFAYKPNGSGTQFQVVLQQLAKIKRKDTVVFWISDFIGTVSSKYVRLVSRMYDVVAIRCLDKYEAALPSVGFITVADIETGQTSVIDTRRTSNKRLQQFLSCRVADQNKEFKRAGVDVVDVELGRPFIDDIIIFFKKRLRR